MHPRPPDPQYPASFPWYFAAHGRYQGSYNQHSNRGLGNSPWSTPLVTLPQAEGQILLLLLPLEGEAQIKHHPTSNAHKLWTPRPRVMRHFPSAWHALYPLLLISVNTCESNSPRGPQASGPSYLLRMGSLFSS